LIIAGKYKPKSWIAAQQRRDVIFLLAWMVGWFTTVVCRNLSSSIPFFIWIVVQSEMEKETMDIVGLAG
jgi:hypothetical protein